MPDDERITKLEKGSQILREAILFGQIRPGQRLTQEELAEKLGMSPTPIREILRILETEGLLIYVPYKGVYVADITSDDIKEITPIRIALEVLAVKQAIPRISESDISRLLSTQKELENAWDQMNLYKVRRLNYMFHMTIYKCSGSRVICKLIQQTWPRFATDILWIIPGRADISKKQHRDLISAIKARDTERAGELMKKHILMAGKAIASFMEEQGGSSVEGGISSEFSLKT